MTRPSSSPAPSSRCGKPTTVLTAWPREERSGRKSVPEVSLDELLESSLLNSVEELLGQHQNDVRQAAAVAREQERSRELQQQERAREARRQILLKTAKQREARRDDIQRMREGLARRDARATGAKIAHRTLALHADELQSQQEELAFAREIAEAKQVQEKRRLVRWIQTATIAAGLSAIVGFSGWKYHGHENSRQLSALAVQADTLRAEASQRVKALEARLAGHSAISAEQTRELEIELEQARIALSEAEVELATESAVARGTSSPPPPQPRRLVNKSPSTSSTGQEGSSGAKAPPPASIASNAPDLDSLSSCDPHDPMCFEL